MTTLENRIYFAKHGIVPQARSTGPKELTAAQKRSLRAIKTDEGLCKFATKNKVMVAV